MKSDTGLNEYQGSISHRILITGKSDKEALLKKYG
jgi:hypothetical protein